MKTRDVRHVRTRFRGDNATYPADSGSRPSAPTAATTTTTTRVSQEGKSPLAYVSDIQISVISGYRRCLSPSDAAFKACVNFLTRSSRGTVEFFFLFFLIFLIQRISEASVKFPMQYPRGSCIAAAIYKFG